MVSSIVVASMALFSCLSLVSAAPVTLPLSNGFPVVKNPSSELTAINKQAHGNLPNGAPPASIKPDTLTSLQLIAFNELFEVAYFTDLIEKITTNVEGYDIEDKSERDSLLAALTAVQAQEELHTLNANGAIVKFGGQAIQPCKYNFPVSNWKSAIALASTFTDVVLGTLQDVESLLGSDGDVGLIRGVASVIGQEGEQNGYYRYLLGKIPSALPFLTTSTREFAFSALNQNFVVPGSCPNINTINLPIFAPLTIETKDIDAKSQTLKFSVSSDKYSVSDYAGMAVVYINQQNTPVVEKISNVVVSGSKVTFEAEFPFNPSTFGNGLTIASVTSTTGPFTNAPAVAKAVVFGPGLIELN